MLPEGGENAKIIARRVRGQFLELGKIDLVGTRIKDEYDLADILQIYRNPNFETFRIIYMKENQIVGVSGITCCLPHICILPERYTEKEDNAVLKNLEALHAEGYYIVHNHPTGRINPSGVDLGTTMRFIKNVPGYLGHIILDHTKCTLIDENLFQCELEIGKGFQIDVFEKAGGNLPLLQEKIDGPEDVANAVKLLDFEDHSSVLFFVDAANEINEVLEVSNSLIEKQEAFKTYLKEAMLAHYHASCFLYTKNTQLHRDTIPLVETAFLRDTLCLGPTGELISVSTSVTCHDKNMYAGISYESMKAHLMQEIQPKFKPVVTKDSEQIKAQVLEQKKTAEKEMENW